jgi:hypothetical protein
MFTLPKQVKQTIESEQFQNNKDISGVILSANSSSTKGKINKLKYGLYLQWCLFFTGCPFLEATGHKSCCCDVTLWYFTQ